MVAECTSEPLVPVIVSRNEPVGEFFFVDTVSADVPELTMDDGLNFAVTLFGRPEIDSVIVPVNPVGTVTVYFASLLRGAVTLDGLTDSEKSPETTRVTFTVCVITPVVPVTVSG